MDGEESVRSELKLIRTNLTELRILNASDSTGVDSPVINFENFTCGGKLYDGFHT